MAATSNTGTLVNAGDSVALSGVNATAVLFVFRGTYGPLTVQFECAVHSGSVWGGCYAGPLVTTSTSDDTGSLPGTQVVLPADATVIYQVGGLVPGCDVRVRATTAAAGTCNVTVFG